MKISKFFSDRVFDFPLENRGYFPSHLENLFKRYQSLLASVDDQNIHRINDQKSKIATICHDIVSIVKLTYAGKSIEAYVKLNSLMETIADDLVPPASKNVYMQNGHYFKARIGNGSEFTRKDMFHVPFQDRYKIPTNRFSIPGLPCLYLADSVFTCWQELGKPSFPQMAVSRFIEHRINAKYLELVPHYAYLKEIYNSRSRDIKKLADHATTNLSRDLVVFPLLAACYTTVKDRSSVFKPEYILPQLLMQWVMTQDYLHGIKYLSTRCPQGTNPISKFWDTPINYAIPVRSVSNKGYCDFLSSHFKLTTPMSWELLLIINPKLEFEEVEPHESLDVIKRHSYDMAGLGSRLYEESAFGLLQTQTYHMPFEFIEK